MEQMSLSSQVIRPVTTETFPSPPEFITFQYSGVSKFTESLILSRLVVILHSESCLLLLSINYSNFSTFLIHWAACFANWEPR